MARGLPAAELLLAPSVAVVAVVDVDVDVAAVAVAAAVAAVLQVEDVDWGRPRSSRGSGRKNNRGGGLLLLPRSRWLSRLLSGWLSRL